MLEWDLKNHYPESFVSAESGAGSGIDADFLDGHSSAYFLDWDNFTNVPTTLSGFGITDAYTQAEVDGAIAAVGYSDLVDLTAAVDGTLDDSAAAEVACVKYIEVDIEGTPYYIPLYDAVHSDE